MEQIFIVRQSAQSCQLLVRLSTKPLRRTVKASQRQTQRGHRWRRTGPCESLCNRPLLISAQMACCFHWCPAHRSRADPIQEEGKSAAEEPESHLRPAVLVSWPPGPPRRRPAAFLGALRRWRWRCSGSHSFWSGLNFGESRQRSSFLGGRADRTGSHTQTEACIYIQTHNQTSGGLYWWRSSRGSGRWAGGRGGPGCQRHGGQTHSAALSVSAPPPASRSPAPCLQRRASSSSERWWRGVWSTPVGAARASANRRPCCPTPRL